MGKSDKHQYPQKSTVPAKEIITAVNPCEWSIATVLTSKNIFLKQLFKCETPKGNLIPVRRLEDYLDIRDQWVASGSSAAVGILIDGKQKIDGGQVINVSVKRGPHRMKFEEITFVSIGLRSLGPIPRQPKAAALKKIQPEPKVMVRICAPAQYRQGFLEKNQWDSARTVLLEIAQWKAAPASTCSGGTWQWQQVQKHHTYFGWPLASP